MKKELTINTVCVRNSQGQLVAFTGPGLVVPTTNAEIIILRKLGNKNTLKRWVDYYSLRDFLQHD